MVEQLFTTRPICRKLLDEGLFRFESTLLSHPCDEFYAKISAVQVPVEIEEMNFDA